MNRLVSGVLAVTLAFGSAAAFAQDVALEETTETQSGNQASEWLVPTVVGVIILCALLCGDDDPAPVVRPILD
jgi:hypothetical protein